MGTYVDVVQCGWSGGPNIEGNDTFEINAVATNSSGTDVEYDVFAQLFYDGSVVEQYEVARNAILLAGQEQTHTATVPAPIGGGDLDLRIFVDNEQPLGFGF